MRALITMLICTVLTDTEGKIGYIYENGDIWSTSGRLLLKCSSGGRGDAWGEKYYFSKSKRSPFRPPLE